MPSVPEPSTGGATKSAPANPNHPTSTHRQASAKDHVSAEPSPAIISSSSSVTAHVLARRFLGPMPENVTNSTEVEERRRLIRDMRRKALSKVLGNPDQNSVQGTFGMEAERRGMRKVVHRIRVRRKDKHGHEVEEDVELEGSDEGDESDGGFAGKLKGRHKNKKKRKDVWTGESFEIGQEFRIPEGVRANGDADPGSDLHVVEEADEENGYVRSTRSTGSRPTTSRRTTGETFVTARTDLNDSTSMIVNLDTERDASGPTIDQPLPSGSSSIAPRNHKNRDSQGSSIQPLIGAQEEEEERDQVTPVKKAPGLRNRFRSAVKQSPGGSTELNSIASPVIGRKAKTEPRLRSKSVQFNPDPVTQGTGGKEPPRRGNKQPVDPAKVLEREGEAVAGTSAGAAEENAEDDDEEPPTVGQVIMRDRMLVRVGYHESEGLALFDEHVQLRTPCRRLDSFEEYIVVWRKGRVELYQDFSTPLKERVVGHKELCFTIPLSPSRSSLSIYNPIDMTIALTTSASRLEAEVQHLLRSRTTIHGALKERVKQSRQYQWLKRGQRGTHVFIMKISERTRALDWFWELWRDMGGELPQRLDIQIPALSTSVRLAVPEDDEEVGGRKTLEMLNPRTVVDTCWEMLEGVYDREQIDRDTDVGLAWKTEDGRLDWIAFDSTVQGKSRNWGVLVGLARQNIHTPTELQARKARHQPVWARLEDGTVVQEPEAVEGFLTRLKTATAPKDTVYVSTHDGNVFTSHVNHAFPPIQPGREGSSPRDIFPDLHEAHLENERERMRSFLQHSAGCVDLRDIEAIELVSDIQRRAGQEQANGHAEEPSAKDQRRFEVRLADNQIARFEAHSPEVAKEWVEHLTKLAEYWKRRHRIDARQRMEVAKAQSSGSTFTGNDLGGASGEEMLGEVWDWCSLKGCRPITHAGRIYLKKSPYEKYRLRYVVLAGGSLITFKIKKKQPFHQRKKVFSLFGSYCYSGQLAQDELHEAADDNAFASHPRVYHDGLQSADGIVDTTFILRLPSIAQTWAGGSYYSWDQETIPPLSKKAPGMLFFRARSSLERDRWVWAINAEKERMVRSHVDLEDKLRNHGVVPTD